MMTTLITHIMTIPTVVSTVNMTKLEVMITTQLTTIMVDLMMQDTRQNMMGTMTPLQ